MFVDERPFPIAAIYLENGKIIFRTGLIRGPLSLPESSEVRIHDPQGQLVAVAPWEAGDVKLKDESYDMTIFLPVRIDRAEGWPALAVA